MMEMEKKGCPPSFTQGWNCIGEGRFPFLKDYCDGLATVFPGTATVESDFSSINYEKNDHRSVLTDLSLEAILHAKQYMSVCNLLVTFGNRLSTWSR